jgi:signal transduction histidine kinase
MKSEMLENHQQDQLIEKEHRITELEKILEISKELTSSLRLYPLLKKIVETASELTNSEGASIFLFNPNDGNLYFRATTADSSNLLSKVPVPLEDSIAGKIQSLEQSLIVHDVQSDPNFYKGIDQILGFKSNSLIGVPLKIKTRCIGVLEAVNKKGDQEFSELDVDTLVILASHAAIAVENARLYESVVNQAELLEQQVEERTAKLTARNKELTAYDQTVAHDLKNILTHIVIYVDNLRDYSDRVSDEEFNSNLDTISDMSFKMSNIIEELLLLSGVRNTEVESGPIDMVGIVNEAQKRLSLMIKQNNAEILAPQEWPAAIGYAPWIEEVWFNYLSNAIKYGGKPPFIELGSTELSDGTVIYWIKDNGQGIPKDKQQELFIRFTSSKKDFSMGYGLGLSIVKRIIDKLGGEVGIESEQGQGSTFFFKLKKAL